MSLSQTTVVSRWLVMPTACMSDAAWPCFSKASTAPSIHASTEVMISCGSCSCHLSNHISYVSFNWGEREYVCMCGENLSFPCITFLAYSSSYCVYIPRLWINLFEFQLMGHYNFTRTIEDQKSGARGTLVDCSDKGRSRGTVHDWRCAVL